jgi:hypothetical protein
MCEFVLSITSLSLAGLGHRLPIIPRHLPYDRSWVDGVPGGTGWEAPPGLSR